MLISTNNVPARIIIITINGDVQLKLSRVAPGLREHQHGRGPASILKYFLLEGACRFCWFNRPG